MEGLRLLKALLLSGPEGCIADALCHVPRVRRLTQYPKGWEEVVVGAADVSKAAPGIRAMAREVRPPPIPRLVRCDVQKQGVTQAGAYRR